MKKTVLYSMLMIVCVSCNKMDTYVSGKIETVGISDIKEFSAVGVGRITFDADKEAYDQIVQEGIIWSDSRADVENISSNVKTSDYSYWIGLDVFHCEMTRLKPMTTYYARAFVQFEKADDKNFVYGEIMEFTTVTNMATVTLTAGDVWSDGTGYQLLLDETATQYGKTIPKEGGDIWTNCYAPTNLYDVFSHKIPTNADPVCTTNNIVVNNSITIQIPAGTYDWCVVNPCPHWTGEGYAISPRLWIAGGTNGRKNDYEFRAGKKYMFQVVRNGENDAINITIEDGEKSIIVPSTDLKTENDMSRRTTTTLR